MPTFRCDGTMIHPDSLTLDQLREFLAGNPAAIDPAPAARTLPCVHRGAPTGEQAACPSCSGQVRLKVFAGAVHGECTWARQLPRATRCCQTCGDYEPARR